MKGEPGLATGLTTLGALLPFIRAWKSGPPKLVSSEDRTGARAPSASYCSTPLHTAPPAAGWQGSGPTHSYHVAGFRSNTY
jgi:hypothetical protein